jgi:hypothetical protein
LSDIPSHKLSAAELKEFQRRQDLDRALEKVDAEFTARAEVPARWFGRLLVTLLVAIFIDVTGWVSAFISGRFYATLAFCLQAVETLAVVGLAVLAIHGSVEAYRLQQAKKTVVAQMAQRQEGED